MNEVTLTLPNSNDKVRSELPTVSSNSTESILCEETTLPQNSNEVILSDNTTTNRGENNLDGFLHKCVIVRYDEQAYPGQVTDVDEKQGDLHVICIHKIGHNRFFCPSPPDTCWYDYEDMIAVITETVKVTGRHYQVSPLILAETEIKRNLSIKIIMMCIT